MIKIAQNEQEIAFQANNIAVISVNDKTICIGKYKGELFAFGHKCPHAGVLLNEGWIDAQGNIACPLHGYKFNLKNGREVTGAGYFMKRWKVTSNADGIFLDTNLI